MVFFNSAVSAYYSLLCGRACECTGGAARIQKAQGAGISCPGTGCDRRAYPAGTVRKVPAAKGTLNKKPPSGKGESLTF